VHFSQNHEFRNSSHLHENVHSKSLFILVKHSHTADDANMNAINEDLKYKSIEMFSQEREETLSMYMKNV